MSRKLLVTLAIALFAPAAFACENHATKADASSPDSSSLMAKKGKKSKKSPPKTQSDQKG